MAERVLSLRELNRATLARQMLLERAALPVPAAIEQLVGLQAQQPSSPFVALWTRLDGFDRDALAGAIAERAVVKATLMRATLHVATAADYPWLRAAVQPALAAAADGIVKRRGGQGAFDADKILRAGRAFFAAAPHTYAELTAMLAHLEPEVDVGSMRYTVRTHVPLVQVPADTRWSYPGRPRFTLAEDWLGHAVPAGGPQDLARLVPRYLAAFGPATLTDIQTWSGLSKLDDQVGRLGLDLVTYRDEQRRRLLDLPGAPLPDADTPAPVRFLPEFDNLLGSHRKRTRVVADEHRSRVFLRGLRVAATVLVDGFVAGVWTVERSRAGATLTVRSFDRLARRDEVTLGDEAERLVRFLEPEARSRAVRINP